MVTIPDPDPQEPHRLLLKAIRQRTLEAADQDRSAAAELYAAQWETIGIELQHRADVMGVGPATESLLADVTAGRL